ADGAGEPTARDEADACADELDGRHQREGEAGCPQETVAEQRAGDRVRRDPTRVVVGGPGDEPGTEDGEVTTEGIVRMLATGRAVEPGSGHGGIIRHRVRSTQSPTARKPHPATVLSRRGAIHRPISFPIVTASSVDSTSARAAATKTPVLLAAGSAAYRSGASWVLAPSAARK